MIFSIVQKETRLDTRTRTFLICRFIISWSVVFSEKWGCGTEKRNVNKGFGRERMHGCMDARWSLEKEGKNDCIRYKYR